MKVCGCVLFRYWCSVCLLMFGLISIGIVLFLNSVNISRKNLGDGCIMIIVCMLWLML